MPPMFLNAVSSLSTTIISIFHSCMILRSLISMAIFDGDCLANMDFMPCWQTHSYWCSYIPRWSSIVEAA